MGGRRSTLTKYTPFKRQVEFCIKFTMVNPLTDRLLRLSLTLFFKVQLCNREVRTEEVPIWIIFTGVML